MINLNIGDICIVNIKKSSLFNGIKYNGSVVQILDFDHDTKAGIIYYSFKVLIPAIDGKSCADAHWKKDRIIPLDYRWDQRDLKRAPGELIQALGI